MAWYSSQSDKQAGQLTCHSQSNSKPLETAENCWEVKIGNADLGWEAWCSFVKQWYRVYSEPLVAADVLGVAKKWIYKMWALLLNVVLPGRRDEVFGCQIKMCEFLGVYLVSFGCFYKFVFQINWLGNRKKEICGTGSWLGFPCSCLFWYKSLVSVLFFPSFYYTSVWVIVLYCSDIEYILFIYIYMSWCCPKWW